MTVTVTNQIHAVFSFHYKKLAVKAVQTVLENENFPYEVQVGITIIGEDEMHQLNLRTRGIDSATDVLSFPLIDYPAPADYSILNSAPNQYADPETGEIVLGDIVLSADRIGKQATEYGHSEKREYAFLIVHSMLHLLGYDHMEEEERRQMEEKQREIMKLLGISR